MSDLADALKDAVREVIREEFRAMGGPSVDANESKPYLTVVEAADLSRLGESTIRHAIRKGQLRAHKVGERVIIKREDLEQFVESHPLEAGDG